ncbi:uncharacterized protein TNCV_1579101 [Trichonephila clavipes]|nr:uncharacterized protein TNCV_1579101 [Trichonephila clavipes]
MRTRPCVCPLRFSFQKSPVPVPKVSVGVGGGKISRTQLQSVTVNYPGQQRRLADEEKAEFPDTADVICNDSYMDDILSGESTLVVGAKTLQTRLSQLLQRGGFELHKWVSNSPELLKDLSASSYVFDKEFQDAPVKTLGMLWDPKGGLSHIQSKELCSKSRVAPLKTLTIPRLETACSFTTIEISQKVVPILQLPIHKIWMWTDSTIALAWIKTEPHKLKTFVSNRVAEIQKSTLKGLSLETCEAQKNNPADLISRGCNVDELLKNREMWFSGSLITSKAKESCNKEKYLTADEIKRNTEVLAKLAQSSEFKAEIDALKKLKQRNKSQFEKNNVAVGCLVLLKENDLPPCKWAMARILEVIYGTDAPIDAPDRYCVVGTSCQAHLPKKPHTCSMGLRSGDRAVNPNVQYPHSLSCSAATVRWHGALSSMKGTATHSASKRRTYGRRISLQ